MESPEKLVLALCILSIIFLGTNFMFLPCARKAQTVTQAQKLAQESSSAAFEGCPGDEGALAAAEQFGEKTEEGGQKPGH
jgi:hypothetical protein